MEAKIQLVFGGELLPTVPAAEAKQNLGRMLKLDPARVEALCAGGRSVLKKNLTAADADRYVNHLAQLGIRVWPERQPDPPPVPPAAAPAAPPQAVAVAAPPVEECTCPKCGERQPKRTLCRACATDMPRYLAAQEEAKRAPVEAASAAAALAAAGGAAAPAIFGWDADGRLGRLAYWHAGNVLLTVLVWLAIVVLKLGTWKLLLVALLPFAAAFVRLSVLRCHDLNWSGWLILLCFVPYVGGIFSLLLLVLPGRGSNDYGEQPAPPPGKAAFVSFAAAVVSLFVLSAVVGSQIQGLLGGRGAAGRHAVPDAEAAERSPAASRGRNHVVMYSLTNCGYCEAKRRELIAEGIRFREVMLDRDKGAAEELSSKLTEQGFTGGTVGTPTLDVNGVLLPNNPDLAEIRRHLN